MKRIIYFLAAAILFSCTNNREKIRFNKNVITTIDSLEITYEEIDSTIRQELFDKLSQIHALRRVAMESSINSKVLAIEASKYKTTVDELLNDLYHKNITTQNLNNFSRQMGRDKYIPEFRDKLVYYPTASPKGQEILIKSYKEYIKKQYEDSLKNLHVIKKFLSPPHSPIITLDELLVHYRGSKNSKVTFIEISDFECDMCIRFSPIFNNIYQKYKDKVNFGFISYGSYVSSSAKAAECAGFQNKFWEMHDTLFSLNHNPDSLELFAIAKKLKLNMNTFLVDYSNKNNEVKLEKNMYLINSAGIFGTPTILINNKLIYNSSSIEEIENLINKELNLHE
jgi:hypothetical protein